MKKLILAGITLSLGLAGLAHASQVAYPATYRDWHHVKSMVIENGHPLHEAFGGIHHLYANKKAMQGYRSGKFPDGAVIAFDLLDAPRNDNAISEGKRKVLGVMEKNARKYAATGGWGFEAFGGGDPNTRVVGDKAASACFECHTAQKDNGFVFSRLRP